MLVLGLSATLSQAADFRIWTARTGTSVEAQLVSYRDGKVKLATKAPREIEMKVTDLSLADRQYLVEYADADKDVVMKGSPTIPEHSYKKPKDFLSKMEQTISFGDSSSLVFELYESDHFIYAVGKGVKVTGLAETAESCWHGMAFQHYEFRENWGDTKQLLLIPGDKEIYSELGKYQVSELAKRGHADYAASVEMTWERVAASGILVPEPDLTNLKLKSTGRVFNVDDSKRFRKKWDSFQTNVVSGILFGEQVGGVNSISGNGYFALATGHAYYKEIQLTKKTETNLISADYGGDVATKSGFDDGTSWAKLLKKQVKKETIKPNLLQILGVKSPEDVTPENLVTMYSLSCYMQSTQQRIAAYAELARLINTSDQVPAPSELVKIFGFNTVQEFEASWTEYVKSRDFK